jgi:hypothetical protein
MAVRLNVANNAQTTLNGTITSAQTTITVADVSLFPTAPFRITVDAEIMEVSSVNAGAKQFTVLRAQEGTAAAVHNSGVFVENRWTKGTYDELVAAINEARTYAP